MISAVKGVEELVNEFDEYGSTAGYLACMIAILYFASVYALEKLGNGRIWQAGFRGILADYAYVVRILSASCVFCIVHETDVV